jgi:hypothetical protein
MFDNYQLPRKNASFDLLILPKHVGRKVSDGSDKGTPGYRREWQESLRPRGAAGLSATGNRRSVYPVRLLSWLAAPLFYRLFLFVRAELIVSFEGAMSSSFSPYWAMTCLRSSSRIEASSPNADIE